MVLHKIGRGKARCRPEPNKCFPSVRFKQIGFGRQRGRPPPPSLLSTPCACASHEPLHKLTPQTPADALVPLQHHWILSDERWWVLIRAYKGVLSWAKPTNGIKDKAKPTANGDETFRIQNTTPPCLFLLISSNKHFFFLSNPPPPPLKHSTVWW